MSTTTHRLWIGALLIALALPVTACRSDDSRLLAIIGGTVVDPMSGIVLPNATVLIRDDRIVEVGPEAAVVVPASARAYDASGRWVVPGLMDLHAHPGAYEGEDQAQVLRNLLGFGITTLRSTHQSEGPQLREALASRRMLGPRLWASGPLIDGPGSPHPFGVAVSTEDDARVEVRRQVETGVDYVKVYSSLDSILVAAVIEEARAAGVRTIGHLGRTSWTQAARLGIDAVTHAGVMGPTWELIPQPDRPNFLNVYAPGSDMDDSLFVAWTRTLPPDEARVEGLIQLLLERGVEVNPNLSLIWAITFGRDEATWVALQTEYEPSSSRTTPDGPPHPRAGPASLLPDERRMYEWAEAFVARLHRAGVLLTSGSDFANPWMTPGPSLHVELERLQAAGIPPLDVLRIATSNGARALGVADELGGVAAGYLADLIVVDGDPRETVTNLARIDAVIAAGQLYSPGDLLKTWSSGNEVP